MHYYEVLIADSRYRSSDPLTYSYTTPLKNRSVVAVPLKDRLVSGFILKKVPRPSFSVKQIKSLLGPQPLPKHSFELAQWLANYYGLSYGESLKLFAPTRPSARETIQLPAADEIFVGSQLELDSPLSPSQKKALLRIRKSANTTVLLRGDTGSGKTRVYLELAAESLKNNRSVILLTPEIALTSQLARAVQKKLHQHPIILHSQLTVASRKKIWLKVLETRKPQVVIGPRSALFLPLETIGLIIVDEAHEPAYKQDQSPRYHASRVASRLGELTGAKVILGSATPSVSDYFLADSRGAVVEMPTQAVTGKKADIVSQIIDIKDRSNFSQHNYLSDNLITSIKKALQAKKQVLIFFNRRGTARLIMCQLCGWQLVCPNCDVPLTYHGDSHSARCHICGYHSQPPPACPNCQSPDIIYKSIGTKALTEMVAKQFPNVVTRRFDSDNLRGERVEELYHDLLAGKVNVLVGTQLLAKGFDLPRLGLVAIVAAETSLTLPDFSAEERSFQLIYQVIGRVGRGHAGQGQVIVQAYDPNSLLLKAALKRDYLSFYKRILAERQQFRFPPYSHLAKLVCRRRTLAGAKKAAQDLKSALQSLQLPISVIGPAPSFYEKRGDYYFWQLVVKSKNRSALVDLATHLPAGWTLDLDPIDLL